MNPLQSWPASSSRSSSLRSSPGARSSGGSGGTAPPWPAGSRGCCGRRSRTGRRPDGGNYDPSRRARRRTSATPMPSTVPGSQLTRWHLAVGRVLLHPADWRSRHPDHPVLQCDEIRSQALSVGDVRARRLLAWDFDCFAEESYFRRLRGRSRPGCRCADGSQVRHTDLPGRGPSSPTPGRVGPRASLPVVSGGRGANGGHVIHVESLDNAAEAVLHYLDQRGSLIGHAHVEVAIVHPAVGGQPAAHSPSGRRRPTATPCASLRRPAWR